MKIVALLSGGKDSMFALGKALGLGHQLLCVANLWSAEEQDSHMFQTSGTVALPALAKSLGVPLVSRRLVGTSLSKALAYEITEHDEIEDLYELLLETKLIFPELQGVVSGAVLSEYQRTRVEHVCSRVGLASISPLWRLDQEELLGQMKVDGYQAIIVKIASIGMKPQYLHQNIWNLTEEFLILKERFGFNVCGEGGEYETLVTDAPFMKKTLLVESSQVVVTGNESSPSGYLKINQVTLRDKVTGEVETLGGPEECRMHVFSRLGEFYTGEITAKALGTVTVSFEHEVFVVFKGLKDLLSSNNYSLKDCYYIVAYLSDMAQYAVFNSIYTKFINFVHPPSRVCVELADQECNVKIIAKGSRSALKHCVHVQSISPWAPANIGPYSQAYQVQGALHLAGAIALDPMTMQLVDPPLPRILANLGAIASLRKHSLENSTVCIVYYTGERPEIPEQYHPVYVKTSNLPKNASLELELHLEEKLPELAYEQLSIERESFSGLLQKRECREVLYGLYNFVIYRLEDPDKLLEFLRAQLSEYFASIKNKSPISPTDLLRNPRVCTCLEDYITDIRVYHQSPYILNRNWVVSTPASFLTSESQSVFIELKDLQQLHTHQFINAAN